MLTLPALLIMAVSLGLDALAASVSIGICLGAVRLTRALRVALVFGGFQALMPALGYLLGKALHHYIQPVDHWVALALLSLIGVRMIQESWSQKAEDDDPERCPAGDPTAPGRLLLLGLATSIDALAAGFSLSLGQLPLSLSVLVIGLVTFALSLAGVRLGKRLGRRFRRRACSLGGLLLILIGVRIVIEHLTLGI